MVWDDYGLSHATHNIACAGFFSVDTTNLQQSRLYTTNTVKSNNQTDFIVTMVKFWSWVHTKLEFKLELE